MQRQLEHFFGSQGARFLQRVFLIDKTAQLAGMSALRVALNWSMQQIRDQLKASFKIAPALALPGRLLPVQPGPSSHRNLSAIMSPCDRLLRGVGLSQDRSR